MTQSIKLEKKIVNNYTHIHRFVYKIERKNDTINQIALPGSKFSSSLLTALRNVDPNPPSIMRWS
jgi:hypothetical protein